MWHSLPNGPPCSACGVEMDLIADVPPLGTPYGLKIYACPECGLPRICSLLSHPRQRERLENTLKLSREIGLASTL
jgi:hypothetical protein